MIRTLSAPGTFVQKYVFLTVWFYLLGGLNILIWSGKLFDASGGPPPPQAKITFLVFWLVPPLLGAWMMRRHKRVRMADDGLLIADNHREIFVPFSAIESVSQPEIEQDGYIEPDGYVEIAFRAPTAFGDRVRFVPRSRFGLLPSPDPAVREFLQRVNNAAARPPMPRGPR
jgi:hypothetical protein